MEPAHGQGAELRAQLLARRDRRALDRPRRSPFRSEREKAARRMVEGCRGAGEEGRTEAASAGRPSGSVSADPCAAAATGGAAAGRAPRADDLSADPGGGEAEMVAEPPPHAPRAAAT